ncbi:DUF6712 family protein [Leeuwenhoekiella sp. CH_XMU1409-2]|uniref:DUF6712 family protein n=1 Tax=Leeuwenhoekiella sp. CH_XMU1409-2 TaxID=3107768 RepID=UPI00300AD947
MKGLIFDKNSNGHQELKKLLGYFDAQFDFDNLITDIELQTPLLIKFIGKKAYEVALYHYDPTTLPNDYQDPNIPADKDELQDAIVKNIQLYILTMAALNYMQSGDLEHSSAGRFQNKTGNQTTAWEWQIQADNAAHMKRAYRALDILFEKLDELAHESWTESEAYKKAKGLLIYNTSILDAIYPINDSGQLYHRLTPFMEDAELEVVSKVLGADKYTVLQTSIAARDESTLTATDKILLNYARKAIAFNALADGYEMHPIEMFPDQVSYKEFTKDGAGIIEEKVQKLRAKAQLHTRNLEQHLAEMNQTKDTVQRDPFSGLKEGTGFVSM